MGYGRMEISGELVRQLLHLPEDTRVCGSVQSADVVTIIVAHPDLPAQDPTTMRIAEICPVFKSTPAQIELLEWGAR